jgi:hypothetical protein
VLKTPQVGFPSNQDVAPGEIPVPSSRVIVTTWTVRAPSNSVEFCSEFTPEESKHDEEVQNYAGAYTGAPDDSRMTAENGLYIKQDQQVPDVPHRNEVGSMAGETQDVGTRWYQRPVYRWLLVGCILLVCGLVGAVVALVILLNRSAQPEIIACRFFSIPDVNICQSTESFDSYDTDDRTTGSAIPSEIGLLTHLTFLDFSGNQLTSTIPTEIGLLRRLTGLSFYNNSLTSKIPSEIGLLTKLEYLYFSINELTSTIPTDRTRDAADGFSFLEQ